MQIAFASGVPSQKFGFVRERKQTTRRSLLISSNMPSGYIGINSRNNNCRSAFVVLVGVTKDISIRIFIWNNSATHWWRALLRWFKSCSRRVKSEESLRKLCHLIEASVVEILNKLKRKLRTSQPISRHVKNTTYVKHQPNYQITKRISKASHKCCFR